jgi:general secretion pathway protein K
MRSKSTDISKKSGFALIAVIWLAGMIAALATGFAVKVKLDTILSRNLLQLTEAEYIADGLARLTAWRLAREAQLASNGTAYDCKYRNGVTARIIVQDQSGLIDLNSMPILFIADFFKRMGAPDGEAAKLTAALEDFRDTDDTAQDGSPEPTTYPKKDFGPKNAPFQAIEEIDQLPGMTDALYRASLPYLTVFSSQAGIAAKSAPMFLRARFAESGTGAFIGVLKPYNMPALRKAFAITVDVKMEDGASFERRAISVSLQQPDKPFVFLEWQQGLVASGEVSAAKQACF